MVIDVRRCIGCQSCTVGCQVGNDAPIGMLWTYVPQVGPVGEFPNVFYYNLPQLCNHCANPPCVDCCPTGASYQREDGIVLVDANKCVGCKACVMSCPYGARSPNPKLGVVQKCTFCVDRITAGKQPYCVESCHQQARIFGDLDDKTSRVYQLVHSEPVVTMLPELGTDPQVYYILGK
jgi:Fe-S-cluster-containing dehydrogenase component